MPTVLLIGYDEDCNCVEQIFKEETEGFTVLKADNGADGVRLAKEHPVDLLINLSLFLRTTVSGDEIIREIKRLRPEVKVIIMSGYDFDGTWLLRHDEETVARIQELGFDAYLVKPVEPLELVRIVKEVLHGKPVPIIRKGNGVEGTLKNGDRTCD